MTPPTDAPPPALGELARLATAALDGESTPATVAFQRACSPAVILQLVALASGGGVGGQQTAEGWTKNDQQQEPKPVGTPLSPPGSDARRTRLARFIAAYEAGATMQQIAEEEGITRERVRQILDPAPRPPRRGRPLVRRGTPEADVHAVIVAAEMVHDWWTQFRGDTAARDRVLDDLGDTLERYWAWKDEEAAR